VEKELNLNDNLREIKIIAEALSNDKRLNIINSIKKAGDDVSHKKIAEEVGITTSSMSFHLSPLLDSGIIEESVGKGLRGRNKKIPVLKITKIVITL